MTIIPDWIWLLLTILIAVGAGALAAKRQRIENEALRQERDEALRQERDEAVQWLQYWLPRTRPEVTGWTSAGRATKWEKTRAFLAKHKEKPEPKEESE